MDFTFHKNYRPNNDSFVFDGTRYNYTGDIEDTENQIVAKVYEWQGYAMVTLRDNFSPTSTEIDAMIQAVSDETDYEVSYTVWVADKSDLVDVFMKVYSQHE